ncbi:MAG: TetR/AcrR family transcriptional regulator [Mycobacteriaceae bacterium]|uniref:TetR/AcrR family transcriptional regulator n=1 Tax=Corynebacterium sp. TaxID=1720 RepID=UPI003F99C414
MADDSEKQSPDRMLHLVWRHRLGEESGARGPKKKWSLDQLVDAAIDFADAQGIEGLAGLSMRKLAEQLGTSAPTLYTYVPGKDELLGLMIDQVMGRTELPGFGEGAGAGEVRDRLRTVSRVTWDEMHNHPWLLGVQNHRPMIGPNMSERYEWQLSALEGCGLDDVAMDHTISLIESHASASAAAHINASTIARSSGASDLEWWEANEPVLTQIMANDDYPISGRVGSTVGEKYQAITDHRAVYEYGLDVILDGIEARLV